MTVRQLSGALAKKAEKEINEKPQRVASDIAAIREWLKKQSHLELVQPTDQWLIAFLRGSKFSLERCKEKMEMYYTLKTIVPEFFADKDPCGARIQEILKLGVFLPLKNCPKEDAPRSCIMRLGIFDPSKYHLSDLIKVAFMVTEILMLEDDNFTVAGEEVVVDLKDVGITVLSQWTPALAKKIISCFEKALPVRMKINHILNTPVGFETAYTIFKSFLGEKLKKRIKVHNKNYSDMYKTIPKNILPVEYGGTDGGLQELTDHWKAKVESYRDWFLQQEEARSDESKRSDGIPKNSATLFGIEGSFRKLEVD
ncbi:alpha-tocopherol transfer protein-like [Anticarsia gemmatalis]|uniref:alpha-tocopherol transfer protein-like n=1 Tax=Anticarsia gemmatalis TaxID=129554 RepID=UPI003F762AEA